MGFASLIEAWASSEHSEADAARLLSPFEIRGTVAGSDTAGLSKMASRLPLPVVLKRIGEPKKRIHAVATGLGGRAIGTWVADNTECFFPEAVPLDSIVAGLHAVHGQDDVRIGFCIHAGDFYEIGGRLYGPQADRVAMLAEDHTAGGETTLTPEAWALLSDGGFVSETRDEGLLGRLHVLGQSRAYDGPFGTTSYPLPYDSEMHAALEALPADDPSAELARIDRIYRKPRFAALIEVHGHGPAATLVETIQTIVAHQTLHRIVARHFATAPAWMAGGSLSVAAFDDAESVVERLLAIRADAVRQGIEVTIGLDHGPVYVFEMPGGRQQFAGDPVNRASKLAEDIAEPGDFLVSGRAAARLDLPDGEPVSWAISGIEIEGIRLRG